MALDVSAPAMQYVAKEVVEPDLQWPWLQLAIPVHLLLHSAKAEIPPANDDRCVTRLLERLGSCGTHSNRNQQRVSFVAGMCQGPRSLFYLITNNLFLNFSPKHRVTIPFREWRLIFGINPLDVVHFISGGFVPMNEMCERAGMNERQIFERTKAVFGYFNLPFDVQG